MIIDVVTLFPEMFRLLTDFGISGRAVDRQLVQLRYWNPRDFTQDKHRSVDDRPYGGGPGMVMRPEPLAAAIENAREMQPDARVMYLSPQGRRLGHGDIAALSGTRGMILLCGRYEGIDERIVDRYVDEERSIGDYVLSGGELAAMVLIDAVMRQLPEVLGNEDSARQDSYVDGLLDCPHYTRPDEFQGLSVPEVLKSGDHGAIKRWRLQQSLGQTWLKRPDLLQVLNLTGEQCDMLSAFQREYEDQEKSK